MATTTQQRLRGRPAHPAGPTFLTYTPNGKSLVTAGVNNVIRVYETGSSGEPTNIDDCQENNTALAATNDFFITGAEDGTVCLYNLATNQYEKMLTRCTLPIRDIVISPDKRWAAVASDELTVKLVDLNDSLNVQFLRDCPKPAKHLSWHPTGDYLAVACTDGIVYLYDFTKEEPSLLRKVDGIVRSLEVDAEASSRVAWTPDGRAFAVPTGTRDVQVVSHSDGEKQRAFISGHAGDITALAWSPNGAMLATAGADRKIVLWETKTQKVIATYEYANVINIEWHPVENLLSFATADGEVYMFKNIVPAEYTKLMEDTLHSAPFIHDPLAETSGNARKQLPNGLKQPAIPQRRRRGTPDSLDDILGSEAGDEDDFVVDDDGAGYALNGNGKRGIDHLDAADGTEAKRRTQVWQPSVHHSFQPGSTPWRGNRKYLCLNLIGFVWTVDQDTHHTVTVEFYDRGFQRDFHFTDPYLYDKACLNEHGALFSCPPANGNPAMLFYRPHSTWTTRTDWRIRLPAGEDISSIALSSSFIVVTTTAGYVRIYTLTGTPFRIYRAKSTPMVTCAAWRDYVLTLGNGPVGPDGFAKLVYTLENVRRDEVCQTEDGVALPEGAEVKSVFFSDSGDPCIYDSTGVLLVLQHWRTIGQARWVPLLDTTLLERLATGRKDESYWPVAVAQEKFHCIILKGGDKYPYFPRPLLSDFDFQIPISSIGAARDAKGLSKSKDDEEDLAAVEEVPRLEEAFVRQSILHSLLEDLVSGTNSTHAQRAELVRRELEVDKALLQLVNVECRDGEERGMKALELASLLRDRSGKMLTAAGKIAARYGRSVLEEKIAEVAERRLGGIDDADNELDGA